VLSGEKAAWLMRVFLLIALLMVSGCSRYTHVDDSSSKLYTEAESVRVGYESWPLYVMFKDSKRNLAALQPIPGTAYIWNDSKVYKLIFRGALFDYGQSFTQKNHEDAVTLKFYGTDSLPNDSTPPLAEGTYNISVQLNGTEGIHTLCGSFRVVSEMHTIKESDLH
jgi:hypothetical protein